MLQTLADRLNRTISVACALVEAGRSVDLSGLEDGIGLLCAKTLDMQSSESRQMLPVMLELRAQLDRLAARLGDQQRLRHVPAAAADMRRSGH